jgi:hypothetical protein
MTLSDRIKRWWNPGKWRDEHPEVSEGEGFALSTEQRLTDSSGTGRSIERANEAVARDWRGH